MTQQYPPAPPPYGSSPAGAPPRRPRLRWLPWALAAVMTLVAFASCVNQGGSAPSDAPAVTVPRTPAAGAAPSVSTEQVRELPVTQAAPAPQSGGPKTSFGDGNWEIGVDIAAGKYKSAGPSAGYEGAICFAQTTKEGSGELGDIVKQEVVRGPITFVVPAKGVKFFETNGCQTWTKAG